jgi:6-pyruvoyltetrahydropterin/6-carboxytetrahydropterin synthase
MTYTITVRHNFETAHRLPHLSGKCSSLHGHSWWAEVTVQAPGLSSDHTVIEFGAFKAAMRQWIDTHLDHGTMLGADDPLVRPLTDDPHGCKVFVFGLDWPRADWPTVEAVAALIAGQAWGWLASIHDQAPQAMVSRVRVTETHVNTAEWVAL